MVENLYLPNLYLPRTHYVNFRNKDFVDAVS